MKLEDRILRLARLGMTPYQIEEQLGIKHFTIHIGYHKTLMQGYSESEAYFERTTGEQLSGPVTEEFRQISLKKRPVKEKLTEEEQNILRRGKNASKASEAKQATAQEYRASTGFECLLGWLHLMGRDDRIGGLFETIWKNDTPEQ